MRKNRGREKEGQHFCYRIEPNLLLTSPYLTCSYFLYQYASLFPSFPTIPCPFYHQTLLSSFYFQCPDTLPPPSCLYSFCPLYINPKTSLHPCSSQQLFFHITETAASFKFPHHLFICFPLSCFSSLVTSPVIPRLHFSYFYFYITFTCVTTVIILPYTGICFVFF